MGEGTGEARVIGGSGSRGSSSSWEESPAGGARGWMLRGLFLKSLEPRERDRDRERRFDRPAGLGETVRSSTSCSGSISMRPCSCSGSLTGS